MNGKDITQKMLERYNDVFADIVNVLLSHLQQLDSRKVAQNPVFTRL